MALHQKSNAVILEQLHQRWNCFSSRPEKWRLLFHTKKGFLPNCWGNVFVMCGSSFVIHCFMAHWTYCGKLPGVARPGSSSPRFIETKSSCRLIFFFFLPFCSFKTHASFDAWEFANVFLITSNSNRTFPSSRPWINPFSLNPLLLSLTSLFSA